MAIELSCPADIEDREGLGALLETYFAQVLPMLAAAGGPNFAVADLMQGIWEDIEAYLPPRGAIVLAHMGDELVGCGFLRDIGAGRGEMKRLFVRPEAQGSGLGLRLIEARIEAARRLGMCEVYADTVRGNDAMLRLYARLGFEEVERYAGNGNSAEVAPSLVYRRLRL